MSAAKAKDAAAAYLVTGDDSAIMANEVHAIVNRLVGSRDPNLVVEEVGGAGSDALDVGQVIDAYTTPPFLVDLRVVVVREIGRLESDDAKRLLDALEHPFPGTILVLSSGGGRLPNGFSKAIAAIGKVVDVTARRFNERTSYLSDHLSHAPVKLNADARAALSDHLGEDLGRLAGLLETLASAYGEGALVDATMLEPFLGSKGSVPIFDLTDAIDNGEMATALGIVDRMMGPGRTSGHALIASLGNHFSRIARLDGVDVRTGKDAAAILGVTEEYPAKKALNASRRLDTQSMATAVGLVAQADLDLKGMSGLDERVVLEILVARLARLCAAQRR
jgi:DNA polymerase III subunit delta